MMDNLVTYKIENGGIWIPASELNRMAKEYDANYTRYHLAILTAGADQVDWMTNEAVKNNTLHHFCKSLLRKIERKN